MLIDCANSRHKARIEECFNARAKFHGSLLGSPGDIGFQSATARLDSGAGFCFERSNGGSNAFIGFREHEIDLELNAALKLVEGCVG
jgi:hypothetical protein